MNVPFRGYDHAFTLHNDIPVVPVLPTGHVYHIYNRSI